MDRPLEKKALQVGSREGGRRLDTWLTQKCANLSRAAAQRLIRDGQVLIGGRPCKPSHLLHPGERVEVTLPPPKHPKPEPEAIPLDIVHEDSSLLVINKPPGMVVHPAPGASQHTLVNALLHHCGPLSNVGGIKRPGIVHRLDKDTSGLLLVAKTDHSHRHLARQLEKRRLKRQYLSLVCGLMPQREGLIDAPIGRDPVNRKRMAVNLVQGREAVTHYQVERFGPGLSLLRVTLQTGRTHQIRVHLSHLGHPVVGDLQYGYRQKTLFSMIPQHETHLRHLLAGANRQLLHAETIEFEHPEDSRLCSFQASPPDDFQALLDALERLHESSLGDTAT